MRRPSTRILDILGASPSKRPGFFVQPALLINYFGQGALLLTAPEALENPFYRLYPDWALIPMVILATIATVIASQAVITGAFSFTRQAIQLGLVPRLEIRHTSETIAGQIYLPRVNHLLLVAVLLITVTFRNSSNLAAAYGLSVTATMLIDSLMAFFVVWRYWNWPLWKAASLMVPIALIEEAFLTANLIKIPEGGWLPLRAAWLIGLIALTWVRGSSSLSKATRKSEADLNWLVRKLEAKPPHRVSGTAIFLTADPATAPTSLMHNLKHNHVLHERNIILTIKTEDTPRVPRQERIQIRKVGDTFTLITVTTASWKRQAYRKFWSNVAARGSTSISLRRPSSCPDARSDPRQSRICQLGKSSSLFGSRAPRRMPPSTFAYRPTASSRSEPRSWSRSPTPGPCIKTVTAKSCRPDLASPSRLACAPQTHCAPKLARSTKADGRLSQC